MALAPHYPTEQAAIDAIMAVGYTDHGNGWYGMVGMTQGSLCEAPYERLALVKVVHNRVDPKWNSPNFYTLSWD